MELERDVEQYLIRRVKALGGRCIKFNPAGMAGMPDRIVMLPGGVLLWVELKRGNGRLADLQRVQIERLRALGQRVEVVWSRAEVDELLMP